MSTLEVRERVLALMKDIVIFTQANFIKTNSMELETLIFQISHTWTDIEDNTRMVTNMASVFIRPPG